MENQKINIIKDPRIHFFEFITQSGKKEIAPRHCAPYELFLTLNKKKFNILYFKYPATKHLSIQFNR